MYLEDTLVMYGVYNAETIEKLINSTYITQQTIYV